MEWEILDIWQQGKERKYIYYVMKLYKGGGGKKE